MIFPFPSQAFSPTKTRWGVCTRRRGRGAPALLIPGELSTRFPRAAGASRFLAWHLVCQPSVRSTFLWPRKWGDPAGAASGPWTTPPHTAHIFVSVSARRYFLRGVEIWGVYYHTSWRFAPHYKSLRSGGFPPRRFGLGGRKLAARRVRREVSPAFWATPLLRCAGCAHAPGSPKLKHLGARPARSSIAPQPPPGLLLFYPVVTSNWQVRIPPWPGLLDGILFSWASLMLPGAFQETALWNSQPCCLRGLVTYYLTENLFMKTRKKDFFDSGLERAGPFLSPQLLVIVLDSSVNLAAELRALFTGC